MLSPTQSALIKAQSINGTNNTYITYKPISVRIVLSGDENKFKRNQANDPIVVEGGNKSADFLLSVIVARYRSTKETRLLYQFINIDITRLNVRYTAMVIATISIACPV